MPAVKTAGAAPGERVVLIEEMDDWAQLAFAGYKCAGRPLPCLLVCPGPLRACCRPAPDRSCSCW